VTDSTGQHLHTFPKLTLATVQTNDRSAGAIKQWMQHIRNMSAGVRAERNVQIDEPSSERDNRPCWWRDFQRTGSNVQIFYRKGQQRSK